jgi:hypothetical protein
MRLVATNLDRIAADVTAGASFREATSTAGVGVAVFYRYLKRVPEAKRRLVEATRQREAGERARGRIASEAPARRWNDADYEAVLEAIRGYDGANFEDVLGGVLPAYVSIWQRAQRDPAYASRLKSAIESRPRPEVYGADVIERALEVIASARGKSYLHALQKEAGLVWNYGIISRLKRRNAYFAERFAEALAIFRKSNAAPPRPVYREGLLRAALRSNELYRNASRLLHLADSDDADDIRMDAIVSMLESRAVNRNDLMRAHFSKVRSARAVSLDEEMDGDDRKLTRGDHIPASIEIAEVYAW